MNRKTKQSWSIKCNDSHIFDIVPFTINEPLIAFGEKHCQGLSFCDHEMSWKIAMSVVYFDQGLGGGHPKRWSISHFQRFFVLKSWKKCKKLQIWNKIEQKQGFFELAPKPWSTVLFPSKGAFSLKKHIFTCKTISDNDKMYSK